MLPISDVSYGAFIVPGLIMLTVMTQSVANASFGIYFPKFFGTIYEHLSAPISPFEMVAGYVGAACDKVNRGRFYHPDCFVFIRISEG